MIREYPNNPFILSSSIIEEESSRANSRRYYRNKYKNKRRNKNMNYKDVLDKYKKGLISYEEYDEEISSTKNSDLTLQEQLERKLLREYAKFIRGLIGHSKYEILDKSYEITCKEQIQNLLCEIDLDDKEIVALLEKDNLLTSFYNDWLDDGFNELSDSMENSVGESIADVTKYYYKNKQKKSRER